MTCIVGLATGGKTWIGGDSAGVAGYDITIRADQKVFTNGAFLFGFCGSFRMGQLLRYSFHPPDHDPRVEVERYMVTTFIDAVRSCLKSGGFARNDNGEEKGGCFIVGYKGGLFVVEADYQVGIPSDGFAAVGCGSSEALGAMYATAGLTPKKRIETALKAAERFNAGVRGPFVVV